MARFVTGAAGALVFVSGGAIVALLAERGSRRSALFIATYYAGAGFGQTISGVLVPAFVEAFGIEPWTRAWIMLGVVALLLSLAATVGNRSLWLAEAKIADTSVSFSIRSSAVILFAYMVFGAGSIGYMTFMFAHLGEVGGRVPQLSSFWALIGVSAMAAPWIWTGLIARTRNGTAFAFLTAVNALGAAIPLIEPTLFGLLASATVFGSSFFTIVAATTAFVQRNSGVGDYPTAIGAFTVAFGLGQAVGPSATGAIADRSGSLAVGLEFGCALLAIAAALGALQRDRLSSTR